MEAVVYQALGRAALAEIAPRAPGVGEVLLRVRACGICHTDIDILHGRYGRPDFPLVPGHEYAGVVDAVGPNVADLAPGDRVVVDPNFGCGACRACRRGRSNLCEKLGAYGVTRNGGFAAFSTVWAENLVPVGDMPFGTAALAEPMGCALNGLDAVGTGDVSRALIIGAGPMGLLLAFGLRARAVEEIVVADIDEARLAWAEEVGFRAVPSASSAMAAFRHEMDLAVDAAGVPAVAASLIDYVADGGKALFFGVCPPEARIEIAPFEVFRRQLVIAGSHSLPHNIPEALAALRAAGGTIDRLVSHRLPVSDIPAILSGKPPAGALKIRGGVVRPGSARAARPWTSTLRSTAPAPATAARHVSPALVLRGPDVAPQPGMGWGWRLTAPPSGSASLPPLPGRRSAYRAHVPGSTPRSRRANAVRQL